MKRILPLVMAITTRRNTAIPTAHIHQPEYHIIGAAWEVDVVWVAVLLELSVWASALEAVASM